METSHTVKTGSCCDKDYVNAGTYGLNEHAISHGRRDLFSIYGRFGLPFDPKSRKLSLSATDGWIMHNDTELLPLPGPLTPSCVAVRGNIICLGHPSGEMTLIRFFPEHMDWIWTGDFVKTRSAESDRPSMPQLGTWLPHIRYEAVQEDSEEELAR